MATHFNASPSNRKPRRDWRFWVMGVLFAAGTAAILIVPLLTASRVSLQPGDSAPYEVLAPRSILYTSDIATEKLREEAARRVATVYTLMDVGIARKQVARARQVMDYIRSVRADSITALDERRAMIQAVADLDMAPAQIDSLLELPDERWDTIARETIAVVDLAMRDRIRDIDLAERKARLPALVSISLTEEQAGLVAALARGFIVPNALPDAEATAQLRESARSAVEPKQVSYVAGQVVIGAGARVTDEVVEALEHLGLATQRIEWIDIAGLAVFALLMAAIMGLYLWRFEQTLIQRPRSLLLLALLLLGFMWAAQLMVPGRTVLPYLFPAAAMAMLLAVLMGPGLAMVAASMLAAAVGVMTGGSLEYTVYFAAGSAVAALALGRIERLNAFFLAGLYSALSNIAVILAFRLSSGEIDSVGLVTLLAAALMNGMLSASIALGGLYVLGSLFDVTTTVQLLELARPTQPLLNELMHRAPGTYHHTLMVANLAEQAAVRIGADALLTRVGAFYHDVGKMVRPYMFVENQVEGSNVHNQLDPQTSAEIIINHVNDGLELARKYRLPSRVRAFISEHHGTMRAGFLYHKALEQAGGDARKLDESRFRYPGPKPRSQETAILMLADGAEAATRAGRPSQPEQVAEIVKKVIDDRVAQGQLEECALTQNDLRLIRESLATTLQGVFHPRLQYPEPSRANVPVAPPPEARDTADALRAEQARAD